MFCQDAYVDWEDPGFDSPNLMKLVPIGYSWHCFSLLVPHRYHYVIENFQF